MLSDPSVALLWTVNTAAVIAVAAFLIAALRTRDITSTEDGRALLLAAAALAFCTAGFARRFGIDVADHLIASAFVVTTTVYGHMLWRVVWPRRPDPDEKDR